MADIPIRPQPVHARCVQRGIAPRRITREASWTPSPPPLTLTLVIALIGALAGAAGFALLIVGLQNRRLARIAERLARADVDSPTLLADAKRIRDKRLRAAFSELADRVAQTWEQATFDPLTGIANRQTVLTRVEEELARAARYRRPLSLILVDLDHFKRFNDSHGHAAGDVILRQVAQLLAANVRTVDLAGRYGGEEFLVVLPETDPDAAASLAEKLRRIIGGAEIRLPDNEVVSVTLSAGRGRRPGRRAAARRAGARRGRRPVLGEGARPQPGLRVPRDRRRRHDPPGADHRRGARPRHRRRQGGDGRGPGRADRHARRSPGVGRQAVDDDRRRLGRHRPRHRPARRASWSGSARRASSTTSASSRSPRRSSPSPATSRRPSGGS